MARFEDVATLLRHDDGHDSVLFSDGTHHLLLEIVEGSVMAGPVRLTYRLSGFRSVDTHTLTIRRLARLFRFGRFPQILFRPEPRAHRWIMALRAYDGTMMGASQREVATVLFGKQTVCDGWSGRSDYLRLRIQRLIRGAERMVSGGYRDLLR